MKNKVIFVRFIKIRSKSAFRVDEPELHFSWFSFQNITWVSR